MKFTYTGLIAGIIAAGYTHEYLFYRLERIPYLSSDFARLGTPIGIVVLAGLVGYFIDRRIGRRNSRR